MEKYNQKRHYALGVYCVYLLTALSIYNLSIEVLVIFDEKFSNTVYATSAAIFFFVFLFAGMIYKTGYPLSMFGFTTKNWFKFCMESIVLSILFCIIMTLLKWYLINHLSIFKEFSLFKGVWHHRFSEWPALVALIYILFVPFQVFMSQCAVQSPLLEFLPVKNRYWISVMVSTLVFASVHVELNLIFALVVIVPGIFWATMYLRHRTIISVALSHIIIGFWAFEGLELEKVFRKVDCTYLVKGIDATCNKDK